MRVHTIVFAALAAATLAAPAFADDPHDPGMRDPAARARDHEQIRRLNLRERAMVRRRDAGYAEGWRAWREAQADGGYTARSRDYAEAARDHDLAMADYQSRMSAWRRAVAACEAGDYSACAR